MKTYIVMTDSGSASDDIDKVFLKKEDAEKYFNYSNQYILEKDIIE